MAAHQAPLSLGFSRQEHWSGLPFPSPMHESEKKVKLLSRVWLFAIPWAAAHQAPPSMEFSRQEYWSGVPLPSLLALYVYLTNRCVCSWMEISRIRVCVCVCVCMCVCKIPSPFLPHVESGFILTLMEPCDPSFNIKPFTLIFFSYSSFIPLSSREENKENCFLLHMLWLCPCAYMFFHISIWTPLLSMEGLWISWQYQSGSEVLCGAMDWIPRFSFLCSNFLLKLSLLTFLRSLSVRNSKTAGCHDWGTPSFLS